jgi:PII-like signaling protein
VPAPVSGGSAASDGNEANSPAPVSLVSGDLLTLTAYFAERERAGGRFLAEEILDLLEARQIAASVMLRGIASFGPTKVLRSDRSLSLSEDPPVTITAVDTPDRISALADEVAARTNRGLVTLERGRVAPVTASGHIGDAVRLTLYLGRRHRIAGAPGYITVCETLHRLGFVSAETFLGVDGTVAGHRKRARFFSSNSHVPLLISGVGTTEQATTAAQELRAMLPDALLTAERIRVCKWDGTRLAEPFGPPTETGAAEQFQKLTVRTAEDNLHDGRPIHRLLVQRLKESGHASGATVLRGIWGFNGDQRPHGDRFLQLTRHVPVTTVIVDDAQGIATSFEIVDELTRGDGVVTCEVVPAMIAMHHGQTSGSLRLP